jgi:hypothetical protein
MPKKSLAESLNLDIKKWEKRPEILIGPNIPKPMHMMCPRNVLGKKWWDSTRKEAYASTNYHCIACGTYKDSVKKYRWLEGHEIYDINYKKGLMTYVETVPLCHLCHNYVHSGRLQALLENGEIRHVKYVTIIKHGDRVLREANLQKPKPYSGEFAEWGKWRLCIGRKKYPPLFKTEEEWISNFTNYSPDFEELFNSYDF